MQQWQSNFSASLQQSKSTFASSNQVDIGNELSPFIYSTHLVLEKKQRLRLRRKKLDQEIAKSEFSFLSRILVLYLGSTGVICVLLESCPMHPYTTNVPQKSAGNPGLAGSPLQPMSVGDLR